MKISDDGLKFIKREEGTRLKIYKDVCGYDTVGVGHLLTEEEKASGVFNDGITEEQALELLRKDVGEAEKAINDLVKVPLTQEQYDALCSFCFNLGRAALRSSNLLKKLNAQDYAAVPAEFLKWNKARNPSTKKLEVSKGLAARRQREAELFAQA